MKPHLQTNLQFEIINEKPLGQASARNKNGSNTSKQSNGGSKSKDNQAISEYLSKANPNITKIQSSRPKT